MKSLENQTIEETLLGKNFLDTIHSSITEVILTLQINTFKGDDLTHQKTNKSNKQIDGIIKEASWKYQENLEGKKKGSNLTIHTFIMTRESGSSSQNSDCA